MALLTRPQNRGVYVKYPTNSLIALTLRWKSVLISRAYDVH